MLLAKTLGNIGEVDIRVFENFLLHSERSIDKKFSPFWGILDIGANNGICTKLQRPPGNAV